MNHALSGPSGPDLPSSDDETCPNGCDLKMFRTHQGPPDCDRLPRDPEWYDPENPRPVRDEESNSRRLAWFTSAELRAELDRRTRVGGV